MSTIRDTYITIQNLYWNIQNARCFDLGEIKEESIKIYKMAANNEIKYTQLNTMGNLSSHCVNVAVIATALALKVNFVAETIEVSNIKKMAMACLLHDIGTLFTSPNIIDKPGKLNSMEKVIIDTHTYIGENIVRPTFPDSLVLYTIKNHHSIMNETINTEILKKSPIKACAYFCSVADIVDAMLSPRYYKEAPCTPKNVIQELEEKLVPAEIISAVKDIMNVKKVLVREVL